MLTNFVVGLSGGWFDPSVLFLRWIIISHGFELVGFVFVFVGCSVTVIRDCSWLTCGLLQNPLLLISFQHEGDCEA
jgi:hypothetical protein